MTNLDYEHRMNALNQLIHETLGVSLNTVRAAYGRARNASINVKSASSEMGRLPVSSARPLMLADLQAAAGAGCAGPPFQQAQTVETFEIPAPQMSKMEPSARGSFLSLFRRAGEFNDEPASRREALPMAIFSKAPTEFGEAASDWHRLRNEFWSIACTDTQIMERYKRDVLG